MNVGFARTFFVAREIASDTALRSSVLCLKVRSQQRIVRSGISRFQRSGTRLVARAGGNGADSDTDEGEEQQERRSDRNSASSKRSGFFAGFWKSNQEENEQDEYEVLDEEEDEQEEIWGKIDRDGVVPGLEDLEIKWGELLEPSVDNALALVLTALLGLAVLQIGWQLLVVTVAIIVSGLKYTVLAAFLIAFVIFFL